MAISLFGFSIGKKDVVQAEKPEQSSFALPNQALDDGAITITQNAHYGTYVDLEGSARNELELITRYREMSNHPECDSAITEIVDEAITHNDQGKVVDIVLDNLKQPDSIKKKIEDEFQNVLRMMNFQSLAEDIFRRWYIDGRIYFHVVVNEKQPKAGIQELRFVDPRKIRKVREVLKERDPKTGAEIIKSIAEYYMYNDRGTQAQMYTAGTNTGLRIAPDSIINVNSGMMDAKNTFVISMLHKAIKPLNQLRMVEDAVVIYRLSRAPERRIFYIDVGNLPKGKAEQYLRDVMIKYRNKMVYDACLDMNTKIPLLDGRTLSLYEIQKEFESGKQLWIYSCDPVTGKFAPGLVSSAGITAYNQPVMRITLDNGKTITCTHDHKFPVWNKGKVEAKDLLVGDSMIPFYTREKKIPKSKDSKSIYEQIYDNDSKKWIYTHRAVSKWKDDLNINNENVYLEEYTNEKKQTVHHRNYNRFDNTPENLVRMHSADHLKLHHQFNSEAGKIGGKVTSKRRKEQGIPQFNLTKEQRSEIGRRNASVNHKRRKELNLPFFCQTWEENRLNSIKGNKSLNEKLQSDEQFRIEYGKSISNGFTEEIRAKISERSKKLPLEHFQKMSKKGNASRWNEKSKKTHSENQTIRYTEDILNTVKSLAAPKVKTNLIINTINETDLTEWKNINLNKNVKQRVFTKFNSKDLTRVCNILGFKNYTELCHSIQYRNHKISKIEYLDERIDVGTLGIDKEEKYHNYHTFALDSGIYTCNSTGELRDDRKHMSMLEDFWLPRREGGKGTEITTLPAGQNLGQMDDVLYFQKKLLQSMNVPYSRLDPQGGGFAGIGRTTEVTRDELKFNKFIGKLRTKFSNIFSDALKVQLSLKGICTVEEWEEFKGFISYDFKKDNNFAELKDTELLKERLNTLNMIDPYVGRYYSEEWVKKNVLHQTDDDIREMKKQIDSEPPSPAQQQAMASAGQVPQDPNAPPPEDNSVDSSEQESLTPDLDAAHEKILSNINKK